MSMLFNISTRYSLICRGSNERVHRFPGVIGRHRRLTSSQGIRLGREETLRRLTGTGIRERDNSLIPTGELYLGIRVVGPKMNAIALTLSNGRITLNKENLRSPLLPYVLVRQFTAPFLYADP